jgi:hypothetical protein
MSHLETEEEEVTFGVLPDDLSIILAEDVPEEPSEK